jgi:NAD+ kinase
MRTLGLAIKPGIQQALNLGLEIDIWAQKRGLEVLAEKVSSENLGFSSGVSAEQLVASSDVVATLGGDGTFLGIARHVTKKSPIIIGVNFGTLGFLTEFGPNEVFDALERAFLPQPQIAIRNMISVNVQRGSHVVFNTQALNDAVFLKEARERLLDLDVKVDGKLVARFRADGLIVATPTGSTAYSLAAGGSIVVPDLPVTLVTPVCPHSLSARPFIVGIDSVVSIEIPAYDGTLYVNVDGQLAFELKAGDIINIKKSPNEVRYIRSPSKSYFDILRTKLNWGIPNNSDRNHD